MDADAARSSEPGRSALGAGISLSDPAVTEAIAPSVDFVWIDLEHNAMTAESMLGHLIAARAGGCASIVRIPSGDVGWVKRVLDSGAEGIILPRAYSAGKWPRSFPPAAIRRWERAGSARGGR